MDVGKFDGTYDGVILGDGDGADDGCGVTVGSFDGVIVGGELIVGDSVGAGVGSLDILYSSIR
jgi:hypothetical protein